MRILARRAPITHKSHGPRRFFPGLADPCWWGKIRLTLYTLHTLRGRGSKMGGVTSKVGAPPIGRFEMALTSKTVGSCICLQSVIASPCKKRASTLCTKKTRLQSWNMLRKVLKSELLYAGNSLCAALCILGRLRNLGDHNGLQEKLGALFTDRHLAPSF